MTALSPINFKARESGFFFAYEAIPATDKCTLCNDQMNDFAPKPQETWAFIFIRAKL